MADARSNKAAVKNKQPAPVQITVEQIMREARDSVISLPKAPVSKIQSKEELEEFRLGKRKQFEANLQHRNSDTVEWIKYATFEAEQHEFDRSRSIFERALDVNYTNVKLWLRYAEMEMKNKFVNSARNIWDRAVTLLPRVDTLWYRYVHMEEMLGNIGGARQVFQRWMKWKPDRNAWRAYVNLELRARNVERAREVYEEFLVCHPDIESYLAYSKFEERQNRPDLARKVFERATVELQEDAHAPKFLIAFAEFEVRQKEVERARAVYKYALDHVSKAQAEQLFEQYSNFEKQFGDIAGVEAVILSKRRFKYEDEVKRSPHNYDVWFDYIRLEESMHGRSISQVRQVYERAIANIPPVKEKRFWKRYIYLWLNYAVFEELVATDVDRARQVYKQSIQVVPHELFTFAKLWLMFAEFEIRQHDVTAARKIMGTSIGKCPKEKLFKGYIDLELQLGEVGRCRQIYGKYLEYAPENAVAWTAYAELEQTLEEPERVRSIYELAIEQPQLHLPEVVWKAYIDFEIARGETSSARSLYKRLLERTKHVKVWISFAQFEASTGEAKNARRVFEDAEKFYKTSEAKELKEERASLLEAWREFERSFGDAQSLQDVTAKLPKKVKKKRLLTTDDGHDAGWEEYYDYIFPADEAAQSGVMALLAKARAWKKQKMGTDGE
jgi:crooked neck